MDRKVELGLAALIGGVVGLILTKASQRQLVIVTTRVFKQNGRFRSHTDSPIRLDRGDQVQWDIEERDPLGAGDNVELRFDRDDSPLLRTRPRDEKKNNKRRIKEAADYDATKRTYTYQVWYVPASGTPYCMEDPEIQIEH